MADGEQHSSGYAALQALVMEVGMRVGAAEKDIQNRVTGERMLTTFNELQRGYTAELREVKGDVRDMLATQDGKNDKRFVDMQTNLQRDNKATIAEAVAGAIAAERSREAESRKALIAEAVQDAITAERKREADARREVEEKAKDAVRGARMMMFAVGPLMGGAILFGFYLFAKLYLHWRF